MTQTEIRTQIREGLGDQASIKFTDAQINTWIDLGILDVESELELDTAMFTIQTEEDEPNYNIGDDIVYIKEVYLEEEDEEGDEARIQVIDQDELNDRFGPGWRNDDPGPPCIAYRADYNVLGLYPVPDAKNNDKTLRVYAVRVPSGLAVAGSAPKFLKVLHDSVVQYCIARGYASLGDIKNHAYFYAFYERIVKKHQYIATKFSQDQSGFRWW